MIWAKYWCVITKEKLSLVKVLKNRVVLLREWKNIKKIALEIRYTSLIGVVTPAELPEIVEIVDILKKVLIKTQYLSVLAQY